MKLRFIKDSDPIEYRLTMIFFLVVLTTTVLYAISNMFLHNNGWGNFLQWLFVIFMTGFMFTPSRFKQRVFKPMIVFIGFVFIPFLFIQAAGYNGNALMFTLVCNFVMAISFDRRMRIILISLNFFEMLILCLLAFFYPGWIVQHGSEAAKLVDQLVVLVAALAAVSVLSAYIFDTLVDGMHHNQHLLDDLEQKNRDLAKLSHIFINLRLDEKSLNESLDMAGAFLDCDALAFFEKVSGERKLVPRYDWQLRKDEPSYLRKQAMHAEMSAYNKRFVVDKLFMENTDERGSHLSVPITLDGNVWGVAVYTHSRRKNWNDNDIQLAVMLTSVFASYIERRNYEDSIERQLRQQSITSAISGRFISITDLDNRVRESMSDIGDFLKCDEIFLSWSPSDTSSYKKNYSWYGKTNGVDFNIRSYDDEIDAAFVDRDEPFLICAPDSVLLIPVRISGKLCCVLSFVYKKTHEWTDSEIQLGLIFGATFSIVFERDMQEQNLIEAKVQAEAASDAKTRFLSNMSHEIRTPMNAISGMTEIGLASTDPEKMRECLLSVRTASSQLLDIINDILDISKLEAGKLEIERQPFHFIKMLKTVEGMVREQTTKKNQRLETDFGEGLDGYFTGDSVRLGQIITNLLSNAVKFTPNGGRIRLTAERIILPNETSTVKISVTDTGIGIAPQKMESIFKSFEQADNSATRRYGGTGLGLAIAKSLAEKMNGRIEVTSAQNEGSTFSLEVPLPESDVIVQPEDNSREEENSSSKNLPGYRILLAEDIEINRMIFEELLAETGVSVESVVNGREAVDVFSAEPERYDLIFMDIQMPVMNGLDATREIRALNSARAKTIPILAMTANVFDEDVQNSLDAGMNDHLGKPIDLDQVVEKIKLHMSYCPVRS